LLLHAPDRGYAFAFLECLDSEYLSMKALLLLLLMAVLLIKGYIYLRVLKALKLLHNKLIMAIVYDGEAEDIKIYGVES
jgi:hypothetical protein